MQEKCIGIYYIIKENIIVFDQILDIHDIEIILYEDTQLTNEPNNPLSTTRPRLNCRNPTFRRLFSLVIIAIINTLRFVLLNNYIVSLYSSNLLFLKFIRIIYCIILLFVKFLKTCYIIFFNIFSYFIHYFLHNNKICD